MVFITAGRIEVGMMPSPRESTPVPELRCLVRHRQKRNRTVTAIGLGLEVATNTLKLIEHGGLFVSDP